MANEASLAAFDKWAGERGWRMERWDNPSGYIEFKNPETQHLWQGWREGWRTRDEQ